MTKLYEVLLRSIGKVVPTTMHNFRLNRGTLDQIIRDHFSKSCIRHLIETDDEINKERKEFFDPIYKESFNKTGL